MRIIRHWTGVDASDRGASVAIGNFDGVHLGHRAVIDLAQGRANGRLGIVTFEPHPREYFVPDAPAFRLMNPEARANRLAKLGVEVLYELPFDDRLARLPAELFAREILADGLGIAHVVVGADFRFGKGRDGGAEDLRAFGAVMGFGVTLAELLDIGNCAVSSTAIRAALTEGRPRDAAAMLGHWHRIEGPVLHGDKRGRDLGYPTANMALDGLHLPRFGVYAVKVDVLTGPHTGSYRGAASAWCAADVRSRAAERRDLHLRFRWPLYDEHLSVALVEWLRPEMTFDSVEGLVAQMDDDCARARAILAAV
jgi:riboflavin kinase / FMN adenylyltransferase